MHSSGIPSWEYSHIGVGINNKTELEYSHILKESATTVSERLHSVSSGSSSVGGGGGGSGCHIARTVMFIFM
jgi:hypothetical protein